ncbi:DUF3899 domain-containing protein [Paenibacillus sp. MER TA 81-3]|uniref:DUF3899 domain-containing protein n=1 Tax=Paenibacillus sp. MER TA 81-3 TaxID=2939573 RepID=UPI00203B3F3F|nr:DUF3899 domain-containing protein [Paenibacillus sp. MER TA 81-3]MCM3341157.1 DUF3899 domain-containing protein [Paenibacillus sp. MER TA 81-3]
MLKRYIAVTFMMAGMLYITYSPSAFGNAADIAIVNQLFLYSLIALVIGASSYVLHTGFLTPVLRGFAGLGSLFVQKSKALREENERLQSDSSLLAWKVSISRKLAAYALGGGSGMLIGSVSLLLFYF